MSDRLKYERFLWFHARIKSGRHPNSRHLVHEFEISQRTAQRDIEFMRDRLCAPLVFDRTRNGYTYTDHSFELPARWFSEDNIMALALAVRLSSTIPDDLIKKELSAFINRVIESFGGDAGKGFRMISEKVSVKNIEYLRVDSRCFHAVVDALFAGRSVRIDYHSPHTALSSSRDIHPLHLMHYMGSWHLIAYCAKRRALRDFALSRIKAIEPLAMPLSLPRDLPSVTEYTRRHFGIMHGSESTRVVLKFSEKVAPWVSEQVWHPAQEASPGPDGALVLTFAVADFREVKRRILSYGADVEVIEPDILRQEMRREIENMSSLY